MASAIRALRFSGIFLSGVFSPTMKRSFASQKPKMSEMGVGTNIPTGFRFLPNLHPHIRARQEQKPIKVENQVKPNLTGGRGTCRAQFD